MAGAFSAQQNVDKSPLNCAVLEALIKERYVLLWGTRVRNVTDTLNNVHKAYLASTKHFMHVTHK